MNTAINYFGMIAERVGKDTESIQFTENSSAINLREYFESKYPTLRTLSYKIAVNQEFKDHLDSGITANEIALLPPFAGG